MPIPGAHKSAQARNLDYGEAIGWAIVSREEANQRRGLRGDLLDAKVLEFNPAYVGLEGAPRVREQFRYLHSDINRDPPVRMGYGGTGRKFILSVINFSEKQIFTTLSVCPALAGLRWLVPGGPP